MNRLFRITAFAGLLALLSAAAAATPAPAASGSPTILFVVRHGEKSATAGDVPLSDEGRARAERLAAMLAPARVSAIYSSQLTFARETAAPLAQRLGLQPVIVPVQETDTLFGELDRLPPGTVALVVNHSGQMPALLEKLAGVRGVRIDGHDQFFVVTRRPGGGATMAELRCADLR